MEYQTRKVVVFLAVIAAHVVVIVSVRWLPETSADTTEEIQSTFVFIEPPRQKRPKRRMQATGPIAAKSNSARETESESIDVPFRAPQTIDLRAQGSLAVGSVVNRTLQEEALRPLISKPKTLSPEPEKVEMGIFTLTPPHKPGTFEDLGEGITRDWVSEYCYWWNDMGPEGRVPRRKCLPKFANQDGGNLFKKLRPKYLDAPVLKELPVAGNRSQERNTAGNDEHTVMEQKR